MSAPAGTRPSLSDQPGRGILFALLGTLLLTMNDTLAKTLTQGLPVGEIMALRGATILLVVVGVLRLTGRLGALNLQNRRMMLVRAGAITAATFAFLTALSKMPIADALAIVFISPVFATLLAVIFLKERVGVWRWSAMGCGFLGVLIALNPGGVLAASQTSYDWQIAILPLATAFLTAIRDVSSRRLVSGDDSLAILFYTVLAVATAGSLTSLSGSWQPPQTVDLVLIGLAALFMFGAYFFQIESFRFAPVNLVAPYRYASLIFGGLAGYAIWGDVPAWNMVLGGAVIVGSGLLIWWRERRRGLSPRRNRKLVS